ncbi:fungal-specific transcription factor domain-containing protein [Sparassis latifolia]
MPPPPLALSASLSSPSSQSETVATPPNDHMSIASASSNGKRPAPTSSVDSRKKARKDDDAESIVSPTNEKGEEPKTKPTRGSRACTVCRRLKMKCVGAENGPPCKRCQAGNHECIFEESNRGKRSTKKHEVLTRSLRKMERTLDTIFRSLGTPGDVISRSPSPTLPVQPTHPLLATPSPPPSPGPSLESHPNGRGSSEHHRPMSPKLPQLPDDSLNPLGLLAEASLANRRAQAGNKSDHSSVLYSRSTEPSRMGVASDVYFKPGPMTILPLRRLYIERQIQPEMLSFVSTEEVVALFKIYFDHMNMHCGILDPDFHTPALVCSRSPFLLTTICAIASRFYPERAELHTRLSELTKKLAFNVPAKGYKSVEIVQAYLLNTYWGCGPVERFEQDRTWLMLGMAIRMATDLNLHRRTVSTGHETDEGRPRDMEVHNRERTWIACFCADRSFSAQMGKPNTIKEDFVIRNASKWSRSPVAIPADFALAGYADLLRIVTRSLDLLYSGMSTSSGLQQDCDYLLVIQTMEAQILAWQHEWCKPIFPEERTRRCAYTLARFYFHYAMLTINSFGLQNALQRSPVDIGHFFARCHSSAVGCMNVIRDELGPLGSLKYSPDSHFVQGAYAVLSLLRVRLAFHFMLHGTLDLSVFYHVQLLRPEFKVFLEHEQKTIDLVTDIANIYDSVAVGPLHTPALYSCFLRALINARTKPAASADADNETPEFAAPAVEEMPVSPSVNAQPTGLASGSDALQGFFSTSEMGPVADISTFPPTMAPGPSTMDMSMLSMDSILSADFWDSVLVPGSSNSMESLSNGFVYGAGGTGLITPRMWMSPVPSSANSPHARGGDVGHGIEYAQDKAGAPFEVARA